MVATHEDIERAAEPRRVAPRTPPDMVELVEGLQALRRTLGAPEVTRRAEPQGRAAFAARTGYRARGGPPEIVVGSEVALELGHPDTESQAAVLRTETPGRVRAGQVSLLGPDLAALPRGARWPLGLVVCLEIDPAASPDPFALEQILRLTNRLPGFMVRSLPGRLWARVGVRRLAAGLSLLDVGEALVASYHEEVPGVRAAEVLLVTAGAEAVGLLAPLVAEARILAGQHKKLVLSPDGDLECEELDCERCDERETCDSLRDVLARRRAAQAAVGSPPAQGAVGSPPAQGGGHD